MKRSQRNLTIRSISVTIKTTALIARVNLKKTLLQSDELLKGKIGKLNCNPSGKRISGCGTKCVFPLQNGALIMSVKT